MSAGKLRLTRLGDHGLVWFNAGESDPTEQGANFVPEPRDIGPGAIAKHDAKGEQP